MILRNAEAMEIKPPIKEFYVTFYSNNTNNRKNDLKVSKVSLNAHLRTSNIMTNSCRWSLFRVLLIRIQIPEEHGDELYEKDEKPAFCSFSNLRQISLDCKMITPEPNIFKPGFVPDVIDK